MPKYQWLGYSSTPWKPAPVVLFLELYLHITGYSWLLELHSEQVVLLGVLSTVDLCDGEGLLLCVFTDAYDKEHFWCQQQAPFMLLAWTPHQNHIQSHVDFWSAQRLKHFPVYKEESGQEPAWKTVTTAISLYINHRGMFPPSQGQGALLTWCYSVCYSWLKNIFNYQVDSGQYNQLLEKRFSYTSFRYFPINQKWHPQLEFWFPREFWSLLQAQTFNSVYPKKAK